MDVKVKICGITDVRTALQAVQDGADALGFVFAQSKRRVEPEIAKEIISQLPQQVKTVGVFVDETPKIVEEIAIECGIQIIQLHGNEKIEDYRHIPLPIIKSYGVHSKKQIDSATTCTSDYILLDSPKGKYAGGNGIHFDWGLVNKNTFNHKKVILAGGLHEGNVHTAIRQIEPYMVDVSSGVETNGKKDTKKIKRFIQIAKNNEG